MIKHSETAATLKCIFNHVKTTIVCQGRKNICFFLYYREELHLKKLLFEFKTSGQSPVSFFVTVSYITERFSTRISQ